MREASNEYMPPEASQPFTLGREIVGDLWPKFACGGSHPFWKIDRGGRATPTSPARDGARYGPAPNPAPTHPR